MSEELNGYQLSRNWFNFSFENPDMVRPIHTAIFMWAIEQCNRFGWSKKFMFSTSKAMTAIGVKSKNTYLKALNDLVDWGFIKMVQESKNQYTANIIALSKFDTASNTALDKATAQHASQHLYATPSGTDTIYKQINKETNKPLNESVSTSGTDFPDVCKFLDEAEELANHLQEKIIEWEPSHRYASNPPSLNSWVLEIERAIRLDGRTFDELKLLIDYIFTQNTEVANFWKPNIQSGKKLRDKFDQLVGQIKNEINRNGQAEKTRGDKFYEKLF